MTYRTLWAGSLVSLVLYGGFYLFLKNRLKAGVVVTFILFSLFQYGVVYEFFEAMYYKGNWPLKNIHRYLVVLYILTYIGFIWKAKKTGHDFIKINYFLNALILLLIVYNSIQLFYGNIAVGDEKRLTEYIKTSPVNFDKQKPKPDIYFIILDGYAGNNVLRKYYRFENSEFRNELNGLGFVFSDSAFSNYYYTSLSLGSTLNFEYHSDKPKSADVIRDNRLFKILKSNGYNIWHMKSGYAVTSFFKLADKTILIDGPNEFEKSLFKYTILRLDDLIGLFAHKRLVSQFEKMLEMTEPDKKPKFGFMHFVAPHPPYIFDRDGNMRTKHQFAEHSWEPKELYLDQLIYVNKQISRFIKNLLRVNPNAVIILQSDHGPWIKANTADEVFEARSQILYAVYNRSPYSLPEKTSAVNTFRYLLNSLFNCGLDTLHDEYAGKELLMKDPILTKKVEK